MIAKLQATKADILTRLDALEATVKTLGNGKRKVTAIAADDDEEPATPPPTPQSAGSTTSRFRGGRGAALGDTRFHDFK